jgi:hypothetical protein
VTDDEAKLEALKQRRLASLGTNDPACAMCGELAWECMEEHHVAGQHHDDTTVLLCRNCHRKVSLQQKVLPPFDPEADRFLAAVGQFLLGLVLMLKGIIDKLEEFGRELIKLSKPQTRGAAV